MCNIFNTLLNIYELATVSKALIFMRIPQKFQFFHSTVGLFISLPPLADLLLNVKSSACFFNVLLFFLNPTFTFIYKRLCAFTPVRSAGVTFVGCNKSNQKYASVRRPRERNRIPWGNLDYRSLTRLHITRVQHFPN